MAQDRTSTFHYWLVSLLFVLSSAGLGLMVYLLVADNLDGAQQQLLQQRLILSAVIVSLVASAIYRLLHARFAKQSPQPTSDEPKATPNPLPVADVAVAEEKPRTQPPAVLRILAVDDNPANLLIIENYLKQRGAQISLATSGEEALAIYSREVLDMIFMDIEMDGMDGMETTRAIRAMETSRTPIIAISAHGEDTKKLEALAQGFDDYLSKPVNGDLLNHAINRWSQQMDVESTPLERAAPTNPATAQAAYLLGSSSNTESTSTSETKDSPEKISKVVDTKQSLERSNNNRALAKDMLDLLIQMVINERENIARLYEQESWDSLYQLNHKLYGGSSYCGVPALQKANQHLEKLLQQKLEFDQTSAHDSNDDELIAVDQQQQEQTMAKAIEDLLKAMDDLIDWDETYDTEIVFEQ